MVLFFTDTFAPHLYGNNDYFKFITDLLTTEFAI